jgi:hypothetical protein
MTVKLSALASAVALALCAQSASAATTIYTDLPSFQAVALADGGIEAIETFDDSLIDPPFTIAGPNVAFTPGFLQDKIDDDAGATVWTFSQAMRGFGGWFDLAGPGGVGTGIKVTLSLVGGGTEVVSGEIPGSIEGDFWGFISSKAFTAFSFTEGSGGCCVETYNLDYAKAVYAPAVVPVPASALFLGFSLAGLGGLGAMRRARRG